MMVHTVLLLLVIAVLAGCATAKPRMARDAVRFIRQMQAAGYECREWPRGEIHCRPSRRG